MVPPPLPPAEPAALAPPAIAPEPPPTPRIDAEQAPLATATVDDAAPPAERMAAGESADQANDEEEHTLLRPPTAPLPADAFRDVRSDPEPSVGTPLELVVPQRKPSRFRPAMAGVLAVVGACAGAYFLSRGPQPPGPSIAIAPAPASAASPPSAPAREPVAPSGAAAGDLDPPIGTTYDPDMAAEDDALLSAPAREARKAARAKLPPAVRKPRPELPAPAQPAVNAAPAEVAQQTPPSAATPETPSPAAEPPAAEVLPTVPPEAKPAAPAAAAPAGAAPAAAPPPPATAPSPDPSAPSPPRVDRENPY